MPRTPVVAAVSLLISHGALADTAPDLSDPHLTVSPRTAQEQTRITAVTSPTTDFTKAEAFEPLPAGRASVTRRKDDTVFSQPTQGLSDAAQFDFKLGNSMFKKLWVSSPASTLASDGLGPLYNARSCKRCHVNDGRGHPPENADDLMTSMFLRISVPDPTVPQDAMAALHGYFATRPDPNYGTQIQDRAVQGHAPEAKVAITYEEIPVPLNGGETALLRKPSYALTDLAYGDLAPDAMLSPRVAPQMIGLGLLEAIPAADILAQADPEDADGDGISGRANIVPSREFGTMMLGRFGHKAGNPTVHQQSAEAFANDIGISNPLYDQPAGNCTEAQTSCITGRHGQDEAHDWLEIGHEGMEVTTHFSRNLGVPERRNVNDPKVLRGKEMFYTAGCTSCHTPKFVTHRMDARPEHSFQLIWPYSDLLLHDMGDGLADNRPEYRASGREWRTPPLWGIGLTKQVSGHTYFLHDGRARSLLEAVLWHGGEAQTARDAVVDMSKTDRDALIAYLESL